jgi:hypothetical protein
MSLHVQKGVNCLDCHQPAGVQQKKDHHGFVISTKLTAGTCRSCHEPIYQEYQRSRHAAPSWAAVFGQEALTPDQVELSERYQPGHQTARASADENRGRIGDNQRLRPVSSRRTAERGWHDRHLYGVPHAAHLIGGDRTATDDLWAVPPRS